MNGAWLRATATVGLVVAMLGLGVPVAVCAQPAAAAGAWRVDGIAAVVGGLAPGPGVITIFRSDVELRARLALMRAGADEAALGPLPNSLLRATFEEAIGEALIAAESNRLNLTRPTSAEIRGERERLALGVGGEDKLATLGKALSVGESEFAAIAERRAVVNSFLTANLEGTLEITPSELQKAYAEQQHPFRNEPFDAVKEQLRAWLVQRRVEAAVARWVESLRQRTPLRRLVTF